ncbi:hypothetical protein OG864_06290 [Streptomyces sp. NBC_00124]|uniref:hypothetical protein n=1 Tax=Streptomyces sp. NBC_00124 TaxID=2975662 RepID=UPI00224F3484|nr:hypothetical protein [Streptomyces sp. NBC_00124]MCX5358301.1 hypothetical protein [Streptomyces sp. NBC_00124]
MVALIVRFDTDRPTLICAAQAASTGPTGAMNKGGAAYSDHLRCKVRAEETVPDGAAPTTPATPPE